MEGESGPKARLTSVVDGKQVNIPVLFYIWYRGTEKVEICCYWISVQVLKASRVRRKTILELRNDAYLLSSKYFLSIMLPRKARTTIKYKIPVP